MPTITDSKTTTQYITGTNTSWRLASQASVIDLDASQDRAYAVWNQGDNSRIVIDGFILEPSPSGAGYGIYSTGSNMDLTISDTGVVEGYHGIVPFGACTIRNYGFIGANGRNGYGIWGDTDNTSIENRGTIVGEAGVYTGECHMKNFGTIRGSSIGVDFRTDLGVQNELINRGIIVGAKSIHMDGAGYETIINTGKLIGDVELGDGADKLDTRGGIVQGKIFGGNGNDELITDNASYQLVENAGEGSSDTVRSTVSYTLANDVEILVLLGKKDIDGTGNDGENHIYGNDGDNVLNGLNGFNSLFGGGGNDTLIGGNDTDMFGLGKGYDRDTVKGFQDGNDVIDIYKLGVDNFKQLKSHIEKHGNDTWIVFDKDMLILQDVNVSTLDENSFLFNY